MDDIKKKKATVVRDRKPGGQGGKLLRSLLITLAFGALYFYMALPAINLQDAGFYGFFFLLSAVFCVLSVLSNASIRQETDGKEAWRKIKKTCSVPLFICLGLVVLYIGGSIVGGVLFRAGSYSQMLEINTGDFALDVAEAHYDSIPTLDKRSAFRLGDRKLGELADMVSQFEVVDNYTQINYQSRPVRVATLRYGDVFKWLGNMGDGLPAYIIIDMVTQQADVVRLPEGMKYTPADHFGRNLMRHLRMNYPTFMFETPHFEIDESGHPYWVCPKVEKTIGLFGGTDINGAVLVDAVTGQCDYYTEVPLWVDAVYTPGLIVAQYDYYGLYKNGFFNSLFGQKDCTVTTDDYSYLAMNDDVYMYTGITSVGGDESNIGFILANQRTKETTYYPCAGAEEYSAISSAQGIVQDLKYQATFPLLLNISGQPTYFMALKDSAELVKMYAMVNVQSYNIVACAETVKACEEEYLRLMAAQNLVPEDIAPAAEQTETSGTVADVRTAVLAGESYSYFLVGGQWYRVKVFDCELAAIVTVGDRVTLHHDAGQTGEIVEASTIARQ